MKESVQVLISLIRRFTLIIQLNRLFSGFGENSRVLAWIWDRLEGKDVAEKTPVGYIPKKDTINIDGLGNLDMEELLSVPKDYWMEQLEDLKKYYEDQLGEDLPKPIWDEFHSLKERFEKS